MELSLLRYPSTYRIVPEKKVDEGPAQCEGGIGSRLLVLVPVDYDTTA